MNPNTMRVGVKKRRKQLQVVVLSLAVAALAACGPGLSGTPGELNKGYFYFNCANPSDASCEKTLPSAMAVGSQFQLSFASVSNSAGTAIQKGEIKSASPKLLFQVSSNLFEAKAAGQVGLIGMREGRDIDLIHIWIRQVDEVRIDRRDDAMQSAEQNLETASMVVGQELRLVAYPWSNLSQSALAGALDVSWANVDDAIASIVDEPYAAEITVRADGPGTTTLTVGLGGQKRELPITVTGMGSANAGGAGGQGGA